MSATNLIDRILAAQHWADGPADMTMPFLCDQLDIPPERLAEEAAASGLRVVFFPRYIGREGEQRGLIACVLGVWEAVAERIMGRAA